MSQVLAPLETVTQPPAMILEEFFLGHVRGWGIFDNRRGSLQRQVMLDMEGRWNGNEFVLEESFVFDNGERMRRAWHITKAGPNEYEGRASDVVGVARGKTTGNTVHFRYTMKIKGWKIGFSDFMYRLDNATVVNRAIMTKFGVEVGRMSLFFRKNMSES